MKVGLISIHSAHNYGSVLQAYALQEFLKKELGDVEIIDYRPEYFEKMYKIFSFKIYKDFHGFFNKMLHLGWRILNLQARLRKKHKFDDFIRNNYIMTSKRYSKCEELKELGLKYDVVFVGSDQVWNTGITEGFDGAYYLNFVSSNTVKASYAASIARSEIEKRYLNDYKQAVNAFDAISVREESGRKILKKILSKKISVNIDPTFLIDKKDWDNILQESSLNLSQEPYIFTYVLQENKELVKVVNAISENMGMRVVSIAKKKRYKNETVISDAGPEDFLYLIKNSTFVVTNSFHGAAFSAIYRKPCCVIPHLETGSRMVDLYNRLGLSKRILYRADNLRLAELLDTSDYSNLTTILEDEYNKSHSFVRDVLKKVEKRAR
ncbi:polysaccharide pyruvyl transferase family protein [Candidatus Saccharibacteria bacterium]|nr:polysaccharide pyruvyl transferase family protein [Candidatus Saccharibacteria bacterium]